MCAHALTRLLPCWVTNCSAKLAITVRRAHTDRHGSRHRGWNITEPTDDPENDSHPNVLHRPAAVARILAGMHVKKEADQKEKRRGHLHVLVHTPNTATPQQYSAIAGTEPSDSVCAAGSLLSRCRFPWIDFNSGGGDPAINHFHILWHLHEQRVCTLLAAAGKSDHSTPTHIFQQPNIFYLQLTFIQVHKLYFFCVINDLRICDLVFSTMGYLRNQDSLSFVGAGQRKTNRIR